MKILSIYLHSVNVVAKQVAVVMIMMMMLLLLYDVGKKRKLDVGGKKTK